MTTTITGGCYCGDIRFKAEAETTHSTICHCSNCRRAAGAQSVAFVTVPSSDFAFTQGKSIEFLTETKAIRTFCGRCGSSLTYVGDDRKHEIDIHAGCLDHPENFPPNKDFFADEKLPWVPLGRQE